MANKILVVDDDPQILKILQKRLSTSGYEVICAADGEEAVQMTRNQRPQLIILDVMMPRMDGTEAARIIREDEMTKGIPIIYLTALKSEDDDQLEGNFGNSIVLGKPIDMPKLLEKIRQLAPG